MSHPGSAVLLVGADAAELERGAASLRAAAADLDEAVGSLTASLHSVAWVGWVAISFGTRWNTRHVARMVATAQFVRDTATRLDRHAAEQRVASSAAIAQPTSGGATGSGGGGGSSRAFGGTDGESLDVLDGLLASVDTGLGLLEVMGTHPALLDGDGVVVRLIELLGGDEFGAVVAAAAPVIDVGSALAAIVTDFAEHAHLPFDERLVHALGDMAVRFAIDEGAEHAAVFVSGMAMSLLAPGVGTVFVPLVTKGVGVMVGELVGAVVGNLDDGTDFVDELADVFTAQWRVFTRQLGMVAELYEPVAAVVGDAGELAGDVAGALVDISGGAVGAAGTAIGTINPWD